MLDIKYIRERPEEVNAALKRRDPGLSVDAALALDVRRRQLLSEEETCRSRRNELTKAIGEAKRQGGDADALQVETRQLAERIKALESEKESLAAEQDDLLLNLPNLPSPQAPDGRSEPDNVCLRQWGEEFKARVRPDALAHWDIGPNLGALDFERGVKLAQSRFSVLRGDRAWLARALKDLMLDLHRDAGYEEISPPYLVNRDTMIGTGQLPKFEADMFACRDDALFLIPTAEVPLTNLYRGEEIAEAALPVNLTAYTPCFRREAGSAGKDTRGLIRQHQFDKVELVKLTHPDQSQAEHERLIADAERVLQTLELPYRALELCTGDMGFSAARCVDLEVWMPGQGQYREISSCSNCWDFQARRAGLKYRPADGGKLAYVHTLNGSALAIGRTLIAILENYQISDQEVAIPAALLPYWRGAGKTIKGASLCPA